MSERNFGLLHYFEDTVECEVDLLTINNFKNPYSTAECLQKRLPSMKDEIFKHLHDIKGAGLFPGFVSIAQLLNCCDLT